MFEIERKIKKCVRCGEPINLENLHPDSLPIPEEGKWYAVHGNGDVCGEDRRAWIVEYL